MESRPQGSTAMSLTLSRYEWLMLHGAVREVLEIWDEEFPTRTGFAMQEYEQLKAKLKSHLDHA
jgi:hypothetical protein